MQLVASADELDLESFAGGGPIGLTAAASTPNVTVDEIIDALASRFDIRIEEVEAVAETASFKPLAMSPHR